jgi:nucleoside-diphosphate-sugar epimerase
VTDLAAAHGLALKLLLEGHSSGAFNLGTGNGFSVREILAAIATETGREVRHVVKPRRRSDLSGRRSIRCARDIERPSRLFGSGHDHSDRLGVAQAGSPAEDGRACSQVKRGSLAREL